MTWATFKLLVFLTLVGFAIFTDLSWWIPAALFFGAMDAEVKS